MVLEGEVNEVLYSGSKEKLAVILKVYTATVCMYF